jgi:hypothetical protein
VSTMRSTDCAALVPAALRLVRFFGAVEAITGLRCPRLYGIGCAVGWFTA